MRALQLFGLMKNVVASNTCPDCKKLRICNYSTLASAPCQKWSFFSEVNEEESSVYKHALMFKRPSTIDYNETLSNSVSLIGTVLYPLRRVNSSNGSLGVRTSLEVKTSSRSSRNSVVCLKMWEKVAEVSIKHLKPNDFIHVWGHLYSYEKTQETGETGVILHEVKVKEINYVEQHAELLAPQRSKNGKFQGGDYLERKREQLHLWQVFFANPFEWNDFRKTKTNPKHPDFKHKNTGEALWIDCEDPPWISRQLQFLDSVTSGQSRVDHISSKLCNFLPGNDVS